MGFRRSVIRPFIKPRILEAFDLLDLLPLPLNLWDDRSDIQEASGALSQWDDRGVGGDDFIQLTASRKPAVFVNQIGGRRSVTWAGDQVRDMRTAGTSVEADLTIFVVSNKALTIDNLYFLGNPSGQGNRIQKNTSDNYFFRSGSGSAITQIPGTKTAAQLYVLTMATGASNEHQFAVATDPLTSAIDSMGSFQYNQIGTNTFDNTGKGDIALVAVYSSILTDAEIFERQEGLVGYFSL